VFDYVVRELTNPDGGFYSTQDADSEGEEGKFFVWSKSEIEAVLGDDAELFSTYYNVTSGGNFEGHNILNVTRSLDEVATAMGITTAELENVLSRSREKLFAVREKRVKPDRDEKVLTAWNGMMLASFAEAGAVLNREDYITVGRNNARFILRHLRKDGLLLRTYKEGVAKLNGYLEDYAFLIDGLLNLYESTGELEWLEESISLTDTMIEEFWDDEDGGFFFTGKSHETLIVRAKDYFDNATPSGNSVAAEVLLRLALLTDNSDYRRRATTLLRLVAETLKRYPSGFGRALCALDIHLSTPKEIVVARGSSATGSRDLEREIWQRYLPNKVVAAFDPADGRAAEILPMLRDRKSLNGLATAYVCENYTCKQPVTDPKQLAEQLDKGRASASQALE
jgi:uncharacterized protein YyaL (SSP411 family)